MRRGALLRIHHGVYAVGHAALTPEGRARAAVLHAGPRAALSHTTAGWWWGMLESAPRVFHVITSGRSRSSSGIRLRRRNSVDRVIHNGLPVTPPARTLLDLATMLSLRHLRHALSETIRLELADPAEIAAVTGQGRPGSAGLRKALHLHFPQLKDAASPLEERFLMLLQEHGLPMPEVNVRVGRFKVDCLWRDQRVIVELDGHAFHANAPSAERDRQRDLELRAAGFTVLRYTWAQVTQRPAEVIADVRAVLATPHPSRFVAS